MDLSGINDLSLWRRALTIRLFLFSALTVLLSAQQPGRDRLVFKG
jgi:hypothetical protein